MQKKFLRTSVLTLVVALSLINEIHAMDYEEQSRDAWYAQNKREQAMITEMTTCVRRDNNQGDLHTRVLGNDIWTSEITGVTHDRWDDPTPWAEAEGLNMITGKPFLHCEGCAKLRSNLYEAHRGEIDRYMKRNNSPKKSPMPQPPRLNLTTWETWTPSIAVAPPEPEPTHDAPSPHFASRPDEQQTDNRDSNESWSSDEFETDPALAWPSTPEYAKNSETEYDDDGFVSWGDGDYDPRDFAEIERTRDDVADALQEYTPGTEKETEQAPAAEAAPKPNPMPHFRI